MMAQPQTSRDPLGRLPGGLYRYTGFETTAQLQRNAALWGWHTWRLHGETMYTKHDLIDALACAIPLPEWQGRNWDALEESLRDLAHTRSGDTPAQGYLLIWTAPYAMHRRQPGSLQTALAVLQEVSDFWAQQGVPFCVLFRRTYGAVASLPPIQ